MDQHQQSSCSPWSNWMESAVDLWCNTAKNWQNMPNSVPIQTSFEMFKTFLSPWMGGQSPQEKDPKSPLDMFQAITNMMGSLIPGQDAFEWMWNKGDMKGQGFDMLQKEALNTWMGVYEAAFQPLLKMPQLGLTRVYQEKINRLAEKFHTFQAALSKFQMMLSGPMEKSFAQIKEEVEKLKKDGKSANDFKAYYGTWVGLLENEYMSLFRSEEYRAVLSSLIDETAAFRLTGNDVLEEMLEFLPIPTNREMDELYKELYTLKKQNKEAIKKINKLESAVTKKDIK